MSQTQNADLILRNARIIDGTGGPGPHIWGIRGYRPKLHGHIPNIPAHTENTIRLDPDGRQRS